MSRGLSWAVILLMGASLPQALAEPSATRVGRDLGKAKNFSLQDHLGTSHELFRHSQDRAIVLIFTSTGCPIVQKSAPKIKALRDQFGSKGVIFWLVNSNTEDDAKIIAEEARDFQIDLPILLDREQSVARALSATRTAEVICIQPKTWKIFYRGAIDDQLGYGTERTQPTQKYLENALNNFLAGKKITPARTDFKGCRIQFEIPAHNPSHRS